MFNHLKTLVFVIAISLFHGLLSAQTKAKGKVTNEYFNISFGSKLQLDKDFRPRKLLARADGGYVIQSFGKGTMGMDVVNEKFEQSSSKTHNLRKDLERRDENLVTFSGRSFWISSSNDNKSPEERAFLQEISDKDGDLIGNEIEINKTKDVHSGLNISFNFFSMGGASMQLSQSQRYHTSISPDETKLLVYYKKKPIKKSNKSNKDYYGFIVIDETFKVLWSKEVEMPKTEFMMEFIEAEVTDEGNVIYMAKVYKNDSRSYKKDDKPNYTLSLFEVGKDTRKVKEKAIEMDGFLRETEFFINDEGSAVICGTYSRMFKGNGSSGVFYNIVDMSEKKTKDATYMDFESDLDADYEGPKHAKRLKKIYKKYGVGYIPYLQFREVFFDEASKSLYMVLESYHLVVRTTNNGRTTTYYYYYDDVYAIKVNTAAQQIVQAHKIPKKQLGINTHIDLGISSFLYGENLFVFFIDNKKNVNLQPDMIPAEHRSTAGGFLAGVHIDFRNDEGAQRFLLYDAKVEKKYCDPSKFIMSDGVIYGVGYEKSNGTGPYYPIKIDFKD